MGSFSLHDGRHASIVIHVTSGGERRIRAATSHAFGVFSVQTLSASARPSPKFRGPPVPDPARSEFFLVVCPERLHDARMRALSLGSMVAAVLFTACGGGVDGSKKLSELSTAESKDACQEMVEDFPEKTVMCEGGFTLKVGVPASKCTDAGPAPTTCTATVDDARQCNSDIYNQSDADLCSDKPLPASCAKLEGCN